MSIAEKLTTIAENEQKVFDAGYNKGLSEGGGGADVSGVTATPDDVLSGKVIVASDGSVVTGRMNNNSGWKYELDTTTSGVNIPEGYHDGKHYVTISAETKTTTPTKETQTIVPTDGKVLKSVTVKAIPDNYIDLADVTEVTSDITKVANGQFVDLKGVQVIKLPKVETLGAGILSGSDVEIFDVGSNLTQVATAAFGGATKLNTLIFRGLYDSSSINLSGTPIQQGNGYIYVPDEYVENHKSGAFNNYSNKVRPLSEIEGGGTGEIDAMTCNATNISSEKFGGDLKAVLADGNTVDIKKIILPNATSFGTYVLGFNSNIEMLDIGSGGANITLNGYTFGDAPKLTTLIFRGWIDTPAGTYNEFEGNSPFLNGTGFLYVPDALLNQYKTSSGWSDISSQIKPISEL